MSKRYHTIYADPPWPERGGGWRGSEHHYPLMTIQEIKNLRPMIDDLAAKDCHLYLWATNYHLPEALAVMKAWGFRYRCIITWLKDRIGMGQYFRCITEHCLFGRRGLLPYKRVEGKQQCGETCVIAKRMEHSVKPEAMRAMIERVSYPPYIELFAREKVKGWDAWGNEV